MSDEISVPDTPTLVDPAELELDDFVPDGASQEDQTLMAGQFKDLDEEPSTDQKAEPTPPVEPAPAGPGATQPAAAPAPAVAPTAQPTPVVQPVVTDAEAQKIMEATLKVVGDDVLLKVRGQEFDLQKLTPPEVKKYLQLGIRGYQVMDEYAAKNKELADKESLLNRGIEELQRIQATRGLGQPGGKIAIPPELQVNEFDTPETTKLKQDQVALLQEKAVLQEEQTVRRTSEVAAQEEQKILGDIETLKGDYPLASQDAVLALKLIFPRAPTEHLMMKSHQMLSSDDFFDKLLKARPDKLREIEESGVKKYLAQKTRVAPLPAKKSGGASAPVGAAKPRNAVGTVNPFADAKANILRHLKTLATEEAEEAPD